MLRGGVERPAVSGSLQYPSLTLHWTHNFEEGPYARQDLFFGTLALQFKAHMVDIADLQEQ